MGSILLFLSGLAVIGAWWLSRQGLASKPWLEQGVAGDLPDEAPAPPYRVGLLILLAVIGSLFALFISAYAMRMQLPDWRSLPVPRILWLNTTMLALSSLALHGARRAAERGEMAELRASLLAGGISALAFLSGQLLAWRQLSGEGYFLAANPANAFFYILTGLHGLHLLGGLAALGRTTEKAWREVVTDRLRLSVELCATYWHFLLLVWLVFLSVLTGWAGNFVDICRQLLT
ncbi:cytochrome c oxidase subunit 3 [Microvirga lotononidis]|uniref:Heme/copper-type cytochrome/quinol oxidase, subunit 3 n=1 Tax=Microvirga lotononidis TaxID=864069 RepID=I4YVU9_9HYPH|nr:cytochrome c oxidase subunit 3 [Microvirga lotononidis]EIM28091.1 heme/copper-type cytochrome/quinol oxidase, subunit 3 [Microvirga lotononidis]WQO27803.1 cytochrome c oxidase subunit 3 [Microvirga lotononidis]